MVEKFENRGPDGRTARYLSIHFFGILIDGHIRVLLADICQRVIGIAIFLK
jgi:hypothetical protein